MPEPEPWELYDGRLNIKISQSLHLNLAARAEAEKVTVNTLAAKLIAQGLEEQNDTEYLSSIPGIKKKIVSGMKTPLAECIADEETRSERIQERFREYQGDAKCTELWGQDVGKETVK